MFYFLNFSVCFCGTWMTYLNIQPFLPELYLVFSVMYWMTEWLRNLTTSMIVKVHDCQVPLAAGHCYAIAEYLPTAVISDNARFMPVTQDPVVSMVTYRHVPITGVLSFSSPLGKWHASYHTQIKVKL